jgi:hypothetical protein
LGDLGVTFRVGWSLESLHVQDGRIGHAVINDGRQRHTVTADWFIAAIPLERTAALLTPDLIAADPTLQGITRLKTDWMVGLQFYLREPLPLAHGHVNYVNSPFGTTTAARSCATTCCTAGSSIRPSGRRATAS